MTDRKSLTLDRRGFGKLALGSAAAIGAGNWGRAAFADDATAAYHAANIDWRQAAGQTIQLAGATHPWSAAITPLIPQFTALTGIKVETDYQSEAEYTAALPIRLGSGSPTPDVFMFISYGQGIGAGWLEPLDAMYADKTLMDPAWYNEADLLGAARDFPVWSNKQRYAFPITTEAQIMFFNQPMLDKKGVAVPKTFDALLTAAEKLNTPDVAGIAMRAKAAGSATAASMGFVFSYGGQLVQDGRAAFDSPEAIAAMEIYGEMLRKAGPIGVGTYDWYEVLNDYTQGAAAIASDSSNFAGTIADPTKSRAAGKTTFTSIVSDGSHAPTPYMSCWQACINSKSAKKKAAFLFLQWATSQPTSLLTAFAGLATTRSSAWSSAAFKKAFGTQAADAALYSLSHASIAPSKAALFHPQAPQIFDAFAIATNQIVTGHVSAKDALTKAAKTVNAVIRP
ncbi:extracellular solute-binding protein [Acidisoma cellulosilytica]|uniref:Extracellular solute-binding protein n=1 Tax=Acidisoma cellulosilyticum TaxID=2802395 RepID=A0A963Z0B2_9PROT|nr:extracellular solute-binding protein [Acidisoma cellulosilyticum]MCB8880211.1 extracellular solute-binding protein [Acidisoma cellulosilyticum]